MRNEKLTQYCRRYRIFCDWYHVLRNRYKQEKVQRALHFKRILFVANNEHWEHISMYGCLTSIATHKKKEFLLFCKFKQITCTIGMVLKTQTKKKKPNEKLAPNKNCRGWIFFSFFLAKFFLNTILYLPVTNADHFNDLLWVYVENVNAKLPRTTTRSAAVELSKLRCVESSNGRKSNTVCASKDSRTESQKQLIRWCVSQIEIFKFDAWE